MRTDYWEIPGLEALYLEDSWVTGMTAEPSRLTISCDFVLQEAHPLYRPRKQHEAYCYRCGTLTFERVRSLRWDDQFIKPAIDASGELDFGSIDALVREGNSFTLLGDFGTIHLVNDGSVSVAYEQSGSAGRLEG